MPKPPQNGPTRPPPRLYLVTPELAEIAAFAAPLREALANADVAAVLARMQPADERTLINRVKTLVELVQPAGAALLLDGHAGIVARASADGANLTGIDAFTAALDMLKPARIAGCDGLRSRHDAMLAGERGTDYVMFGEPWDRRPPFDAIVERIEWWAEVFEIPCVGFAASLDEVAPLAAAGADFVAVGDFVWNDPQGPAAALAAVTERLAMPETAE